MTTETTKCTHYWLVSDPEGATSKAKCRKCGAEAEFYNCPDIYKMRRQQPPVAERDAETASTP